MELPSFIIQNQPIPASASVATFAGGCFWCIEQAFEAHPGVYEAIVGYAGGDKSNASYRLVSQGTTNHREATQVHYDPKKISYQELLDIFWRQTDPTDPDGQFADRGHHYTTAIYFNNETEQQIAEKSKQELHDSKKFIKPIVTEILPFLTFFEAEEDHQNFAKKKKLYYQKYKNGSGRGPYIQKTWQD